MKLPQPIAESVELARGAVALAAGLLWLPGSRALVAADAHLGYEDVVGGALPLWSTTEMLARLTLVSRRMAAREIIFLGDVIHATRMSEGAARTIAAGLDLLRDEVQLTLVAGNHEGRTRAFAILGATVEHVERDGWRLVHGDRPPLLGVPAIIGHLHPSLRLGGGSSAPAFVGSERLVVVPALTPYSSGLDVLSEDCTRAIGLWLVHPKDAHVVVAAGDRLYPFGSLAALGAALLRPPEAGRPGRFRRVLRPDGD